MSLILDALRKSEAERRRGEAPSLYASLPVPGTRRRPTALRYLPWVVVAVLAFVALFVMLKDDAPATKQELTQESASAEGKDASAADAGFESAAAVVASSPAPAPPPPVATPAAPSAPTPTVDALVRTPPNAIPPTTAPTTVAAAPPAAVPAPVVAPTPAVDADEPLPPVAVLDTSTRSSLPALKLSMHFYSSDPARRFAIIDGQRVVEGTQLGSGVVTQIRRDGVVLDVNGRRVLLPRP